MVLLHEEHLRRFVHVWRLALESSVSLPPTDDPAYVSLEALGRHVLSAAGSMIWMCEVLALPDPGIHSAPDAFVCFERASLNKGLTHGGDLIDFTNEISGQINNVRTNVAKRAGTGET